MENRNEKMASSQPLASPSSAEIFTMPEQYRHGKEAKVVEPTKEAKPAPAPIPTTPPPPKPKPQAPVPPHLAKKQNHTALLIAGGVVLLALVVGGYILLRSVQKQAPAPVEQPPAQPITRPAVEKEEVPEAEKIEEVVAESPFVAEIVPGKDSDSDGLTDVEETQIYQTNSNLPDTDADGFLDGNEVFHGYNPQGTAPGTLKEAGLLHTSERGSVRIDYPAIWETDSTEAVLHTLNPPTGELIYVGIDPYSEGTVSLESLLASWIVSAGGQEKIFKTKTKRGQDLYLSQDKRFALLVLEGTTVTLRYELQSKSTIDYLQTFQMILNSVVKIP